MTHKLKIAEVHKCTWCKSPVRNHIYIHGCEVGDRGWPEHELCYSCLVERDRCNKCNSRFVKIVKQDCQYIM